MARPDRTEEYILKLRDYYHKHRIIPSFDVISEILGFKSKGSATKLFKKLVDSGYFKKDGYSFIPQDKFISVTVYNSVRAGVAEEATEEGKFTLDINTYIIESPLNSVFITVKGDSMIDAGIFEGDIVVVDKTKHPFIGDIVVGVVDGDYTLKYLDQDTNGKNFLKPGNKNYPDIYPINEMEIFGVVVSVIRKIR